MTPDPTIQPELPLPHVPHGEHSPTTIHHSVHYVRIFLILVALTIVTVLASTILSSLKRPPNELVNVGIALVIASLKAFFVVRFFMHLKFEGKLIYTILFAPLTLAVILTLALIPDIALGRHTAFNDMVGFFEAMVGRNGQ